ncbi:hypothetical protein TREMEDRAFT_67590 [Tremella mesenterica DSM 1558]|uniref:uncharacterized protein n=1 Tax=Tremella mesenterica (strain ATCC 24925 / CBS 8224 / DSM 1558 / NBRC 9311 / NRRL Y-6157 / RJB 2259-6 / UBC 559-6) TaxID=578456 RepID=UPI0003F49634|nr:uncharacterized protein TREMEDRAFT_67590 [Tremella mesenterica DSM 1558]EIW71137.1 hypothetical protein TREMEDRAFT_67590 [Tremella mesenterica DSM 1558]
MSSSMSGIPGPPRLSLSTQPGPSLTPIRRPQGARRRGIAPGLFVANPDNSDEESSSPQRISPSKTSPLSSWSTHRNQSITSSIPVPIPPSPQESTTTTQISTSQGLQNGQNIQNINGHTSIPSPVGIRGNGLPFGIPSIPAPLSSPLPSQAIFLTSTNNDQIHSPVPPQPPPQPERHMRRAYTTPTATILPTDLPRPSHEPRTASGTNLRERPPASPSRALPPLPSPSSSPMGLSGQIGQIVSSPPPMSSQPSSANGHAISFLPQPPTPSSSYSSSDRPLPLSGTRVTSPEDTLSPASGSEGGRGPNGAPMIGRARSGSMHKRLLQVTLDGDNFTLVDITSMHTAPTIMETIFSKLRFADDDYPGLRIYRTEFGEAPDPQPLSPEALLQLCETLCDSKALLKLLVKQTGVPSAFSAPVVPPATVHYRSNAERRADMPPIATDFAARRLRRTPSRHSKEGSQSSISDAYDLGAGSGNSASEWSEVDADGELRRRRRLLGSSSSRSPRTDPSTSLGTSSPSLPTPPAPPHFNPPLQSWSASSSPSIRGQTLDVPRSPSIDGHKQQRGSLTPTAQAFPFSDNQAGPSRPQNRPDAGLGLNIDLSGMDPETRALIEQFKREEDEARLEAEERKRQEEADLELARKEQRAERIEWERLQGGIEDRRRQQEQDEAQARQVQEHERRLEDQRRAQEAANAQWEANQELANTQWDASQEHDTRAAVMSQTRRQIRDQWIQRGQMARTGQDVDSWISHVPVEAPQNALGQRRPSDHQYPTINPLFERQSYDTTPEFQSPVPTAAGVAQYLQPRRPSGYLEANGGQDRLSDPRLHQLGRIPPGQNVSNAGTNTMHRQDTHTRHPYAYPRLELHSPSLSNVRSMENLRPIPPQGPAPRSPYQSVPPRAAITPSPGYIDTRNFPATAGGRSPSFDRMQDGRYPDSSQSAPARVPPLQINSSSGSPIGIVPFPSPQLSSASPASWRSPREPQRRPSHDQNTSRPSSIHYDRSPPIVSPQTSTLPRRPSTYYDESSPPPTARIFINDDNPDFRMGAWRQRSGSDNVSRQTLSPQLEELRHVGQGGILSDDGSHLPYVRSPEQSWLEVPRQRTDTSDSASVAGTVSSGFSEATIRARTMSGEGDEDDSGNTARVGDLQKRLQDMIHSARPMVPNDEDDEDEATLWITAPSRSTDSPKPLHRTMALRPSPSKPNLTVNTNAAARNMADRSATTPSDSATESEGERIHRVKSFARQKDPDQWLVRPDPDMLYDNLSSFFPKIDLDKPIVEGGMSTPTTPSESPQRPVPDDSFPPPPVHPSRLQSQTQHISSAVKNEEAHRPPPLHPARTAFNKAENRKSIRVMADHKRKTMLKENRDGGEKEPRNVLATRADRRVERRKSSSMWGHRVVEVTPGKMSSIPPAIPESPSSDGKPPIMNWVKGELIGKGSYGRVYLAMNVSTGDMMAVKQVELPATERDRNDSRQMGMIDALRSEIALLKDLYHPNIVAYLGCETSPEYLSIFLEYVGGGTIASIYRTPNQGRFEEQLVKYFTAQILEGLAYLHSRNICHRDLKGDNILVDAEGICKISDFGISKQTADAYDSFGQATNMKGSVFWMAPEVIHSVNDRTYSGKVDIWSLGCVVLEMWTGQRPWGEMEQVAAMVKLFSNRARPPLPPDIHLSATALDFMNEKCMAKNPRDRPMAVELLQHPFITEYDPNWTFAESKIGMAVRKKAPKRTVV